MRSAPNLVLGSHERHILEVYADTRNKETVEDVVERSNPRAGRVRPGVRGHPGVARHVHPATVGVRVALVCHVPTVAQQALALETNLATDTAASSLPITLPPSGSPPELAPGRRHPGIRQPA